ncbi:5-formyltetrahydrofolate cyclo-ligase [Saccharibacillus sp. CPCC 101409]|uniref:5-formyltetrahydrofolate cyclo-ligase n=1 Tax=Saccharibacillus sp. CPCC 101409 TaxID=3058041 RepID=UPI0026723918|nr:5-formyltetrahydrofolate cyclo-ligase [Saccharibacillus sp. CPCC 101409]MDO3408588.1 5-formyltetrahydrofolate cyclo-ligase [Saccharibacillus sp. CPCC 101409]
MWEQEGEQTSKREANAIESLQDKARLRRAMEQVRDGLPERLRIRASADVCALAASRLAALREKKGSPLALFSYLPYRGELDVRPLLDDCRSCGDIVLAPRIDKVRRRMRLLRLDRSADEAPGSWGVPEPKEGLPEWPEERLGELDVVLVPGLAFDRRGGRIGYGGGFYDRFTERLQAAGGRPELWALAFDEQIVDEVPLESHDFRLDLLIAPSGTAETPDGV